MEPMGFEFLDMPVPRRAEKPREVGLTFTGDWGLSIPQVEGWLEAVGRYLDVVKFAVLTSRLMPRSLLCGKCELYAQHQVAVFPGGMVTEAAVVRGKVNEFLAEARDIGCTVIEVSESELVLDPDSKLRLVEKGVKEGFRVLAEVGPHHPDEPFHVAHTIQVSQRLLEAGAWKIVLEGEVLTMMRPWENHDGARQVHALVDGIGRDSLIVEGGGNLKLAGWFIENYGPDVSFGNVEWERIMPLEHLRRGLNISPLWFGSFASWHDETP